MKKSLLFFFVLFSYLSHAQYIPNPSFEQWNNVGGWFDNPDDWMTNNGQIVAPVSKDIVYNTEGQYAMRVSANGWALCRFDVQADLSGFHFDYYFSASGSDTALAIMEGYYNGMLAGSDTAKLYNPGSGNTRAIFFSGPPLWVDSIDIIVEGGQNQGTFIVVDNFREIVTGIDEANTLAGKVWYSQEKLFVIDCLNSDISIFNSAGMQLAKQSINSNEMLIDVSCFAAGVYYAQVILAGKISSLKFLKYE